MNHFITRLLIFISTPALLVVYWRNDRRPLRLDALELLALDFDEERLAEEL
mgnify:CR=1 FL=1